jgi:hypothetical protein
MKTKVRVLGLIVATGLNVLSQTAGAQSSLGNGSFQDLDFESGIALAYPSGQPTTAPGEIYAAQALPGWSAYVNGVAQSWIEYNTSTVDVPQIVVVGSTGVQYVFLQGGIIRFPTPGVVSIEQTGSIPVGANSLMFGSAQLALNSVGVSLAINGQSIPLNFVRNSGSQALFIGDISQFAGKTATISFASAGATGDYVDNITFSSQVVPESSIVTLIGFGGAVLIWKLRRRKE